ncbi:MAG: hypothetical protein GX606_04890 [Elusimicrobia bacterium]|nr:hypothetical protein [Elusimicrobiota bacterium]
MSHHAKTILRHKKTAGGLGPGAAARHGSNKRGRPLGGKSAETRAESFMRQLRNAIRKSA